MEVKAADSNAFAGTWLPYAEKLADQFDRFDDLLAAMPVEKDEHHWRNTVIRDMRAAMASLHKARKSILDMTERK